MFKEKGKEKEKRKKREKWGKERERECLQRRLLCLLTLLLQFPTKVRPHGSQWIYNLMFEQFAQVLTLPNLSQFRFVFSGHYELAVFILDRQAH